MFVFACLVENRLSLKLLSVFAVKRPQQRSPEERKVELFIEQKASDIFFASAALGTSFYTQSAHLNQSTPVA